VNAAPHGQIDSATSPVTARTRARQPRLPAPPSPSWPPPPSGV